MGNPTNFRDFIAILQPGDSLFLLPGNYSLSLRLTGVQGTSDLPIFIGGLPGLAKPVFLGNSCCNTVALRSCKFLHLRDIICDGQNITGIDAIKAEGGTGNECHNIEIEGFEIFGYAANQQNVGISTKTPCWNWWVHHNVIDGAGTGMYFGDSNGEEPFVNGVIEYNLVTNTVGYNAQVKQQNLDTRNISLGMPAEGVTIFRYNVFHKGNSSSTGNSARPNLLVGNFPASGLGSNDHYEIYGNLFFQNPVEALFQGTGNLSLFDNLLYNNAGGWGVSIQTHNNFQPRDIDIFHNTVLIDGATGISLTGLNGNFTQRIHGNAVFAPTAISGGSQLQNVTDIFINASNYLKTVSGGLASFDFTPLGSTLDIAGIDLSLYAGYSRFDRDFDGKPRDGTYAGAYYSTSNSIWDYMLSIRDEILEPMSTATEIFLDAFSISIYPCPSSTTVQIEGLTGHYNINVLDVNGQLHQNVGNASGLVTIDVTSLPAGTFFISVLNKSNGLLHMEKMIKN